MTVWNWLRNKEYIKLSIKQYVDENYIPTIEIFMDCDFAIINDYTFTKLSITAERKGYYEIQSEESMVNILEEMYNDLINKFNELKYNYTACNKSEKDFINGIN